MGWIAYQNVFSLLLFGIVSMITLPRDLSTLQMTNTGSAWGIIRQCTIDMSRSIHSVLYRIPSLVTYNGKLFR